MEPIDYELRSPQTNGLECLPRVCEVTASDCDEQTAAQSSTADRRTQLAFKLCETIIPNLLVTVAITRCDSVFAYYFFIIIMSTVYDGSGCEHLGLNLKLEHQIRI